MKTLRINTFIHTGIESSLENCRELLIEDKPFGGGNFGKVFHCDTVDRKVVAPLVVKIFKNATTSRHCMNTLRHLQLSLRHEHEQYVRSGSSLFQELPALAGAPLLSFEGELDGQSVSGCVAYNLCASGMEELADAFSETDEHEDCRLRFEVLSFEERIEMASSLIAAMKFLHEKASFLHCDLKPEAVFFKTNPPEAAFIDYDGGVVLRSSGDTPSTLGTPTGWIALEILLQMNRRNTDDSVRVSLPSEQWSAACVAHAMICPLTPDPFFFLTAFSKDALRAYAAKYTWPEIDNTFAYFNPVNEDGYLWYRNWFDNELPPALRRLFSHVFSSGLLDPMQRVSFVQWTMVLQSAVVPAIHSFVADPAYVTDKRPVRLSWKTSGAKRLELRGIGDVTGRAFYDSTVRRTSEFELVLTPKTGIPLRKRLRVEVDDRPPVVHFFRTNVSFLADARPARLSWSADRAARVEITPGLGDVTSRSSIEVAPRRDTTYTLRVVSPLDVETLATLHINVSKEAPKIQHFKSSIVIAHEGDDVEIEWATTGAETVSITPNIGQVAQQGAGKVRPTGTTKYTLTAESRFGVLSAKTIVVFVTKHTVLNPNPTALLTDRAVLRPVTKLHSSSANLLKATTLRPTTKLLPRPKNITSSRLLSSFKTRWMKRQMEDR